MLWLRLLASGAFLIICIVVMSGTGQSDSEAAWQNTRTTESVDNRGLTIVGLSASSTVLFDTIATPRSRLAVSSIGGFGLGPVTAGGVNLDYTAFGNDCDPLATVYIFDGGPFVITDVTGTPVYTTALYNQSTADTTAFRPLATSVPMSVTDPHYDGYITDVFVNRDSTVGLIREWFAPSASGQAGDSVQFVISRTHYFNLTAAPLTNVLVGEIVDWNIPTARPDSNSSGLAGHLVTISGLDTNAVAECQPYASRFGATEVLGWYYTSDVVPGQCEAKFDAGQFAASTADLLTTGSSGNGNVSSILSLIGAVGLATAASFELADYHTVTTFGTESDNQLQTGYTLGVGDTLVAYLAHISLHRGTASDVASAFDRRELCDWIDSNIVAHCDFCDCCELVGDLNCDGAVNAADLPWIISYLFIDPGTEQCCPRHFDMNADGSFGLPDISVLVDHLFISFTPLPPCF